MSQCKSELTGLVICEVIKVNCDHFSRILFSTRGLYLKGVELEGCIGGLYLKGVYL